MSLLDPCGEKIVMIEYHGDYPHAVFSERNQWDFDWLPNIHTLAYHLSGCGPGPYIHAICKRWGKEGNSSIWIAKRQKVSSGSLRKRSRPKRYGENLQYSRLWRSSKSLSCAKWKRKLPRWGYRFLPNPKQLPCGVVNPFESFAAIESETVWCTVCQQRLLDDPYDGWCEHLHWCDECCQLGGPGSEDSCSCQIKNEEVSS